MELQYKKSSNQVNVFDLKHTQDFIKFFPLANQRAQDLDKNLSSKKRIPEINSSSKKLVQTRIDKLKKLSKDLHQDKVLELQMLLGSMNTQSQAKNEQTELYQSDFKTQLNVMDYQQFLDDNTSKRIKEPEPTMDKCLPGRYSRNEFVQSQEKAS